MPANLRNLVCWALHSDVNQRPKSFQDIVDSLITPELTAWSLTTCASLATPWKCCWHCKKIASAEITMWLVAPLAVLAVLVVVTWAKLGEVEIYWKRHCASKNVYGPEHRVVATILTNLGNAYGDLVIRKSSEIYWQRHCASKSVSMELNTEK